DVLERALLSRTQLQRGGHRGLTLIEPVLTAGDHHGRAPDGDPPDALSRAVDLRVEHGRPPDLRALVDLDLLGEADPPVTNEVQRQGARGRAGGGVLTYSERRPEHARLIPPPAAGE